MSIIFNGKVLSKIAVMIDTTREQDFYIQSL